MMKKLSAFLSIVAFAIPMFAALGCGSEETVASDPNAKPAETAPPTESGKSQGGVAPPSVKEDGK